MLSCAATSTCGLDLTMHHNSLFGLRCGWVMPRSLRGARGGRVCLVNDAPGQLLTLAASGLTRRHPWRRRRLWLPRGTRRRRRRPGLPRRSRWWEVRPPPPGERRPPPWVAPLVYDDLPGLIHGGVDRKHHAVSPVQCGCCAGIPEQRIRPDANESYDTRHKRVAAVSKRLGITVSYT